MTQRPKKKQITNRRSNNLRALVGGTRGLSKITLKFRHLKYRKSEEKNRNMKRNGETEE